MEVVSWQQIITTKIQQTTIVKTIQQTVVKTIQQIQQTIAKIIHLTQERAMLEIVQKTLQQIANRS